MRKLVVMAFVAAAAFGFGCAITNYELISDNDQGGIVNTNGKAYVKQFAQVATEWPDGVDNIMWFVDQNAAGDRTLTSENWETTADNLFRDDIYCSPDYGGCAVVTADDPEVGDVDDFDYRGNANCSGWRSLFFLVSTTRYYGECGRIQAGDRTMKLLGLANEMTPVQINGATWLRTNLNALNTSIVVNNKNGSVFAVPMTGQVGVSFNLAQRRMILDLTNPNNRNLMQAFLNWNKAYPGPSIDATITITGVSNTFKVKPTLQAEQLPKLHY